MPLADVIILVFLGLAAGALGGLLGIGGSVVMIPVLTLLLGRDQHLSQAAAMIVNVFVAAPAVVRHRRANAIEWRIVARMIPAGLVGILLGVFASNALAELVLRRAFGVFLVYVTIVNAGKLLGPGGAIDAGAPRHGWTRAGAVGATAGFAAGLLGIGGGVIAVPLLQRLCHLPLRRAIAASATMMCVTSIFGAIAKNAALPDLGLDPAESILIAACLAPTAIVGGLLGAGFTHTLPLRWVRAAFTALVATAALKFLGVW